MGRVDRIFSIHADGSLIPLDERDYSSELDLQQLLARYPDLLAGHHINAEVPRRWLLIGREFQIPDDEGGNIRWSLDHLFVDQDGTPTLIEVKRSTDGRLRREVIGQMLDYASNLTAWIPVEEIQRVFADRCEKEGLNPTAEISRLLALPPEEDAGGEVLWQRVRTKLQAGGIRLIFVADDIPKELRRVVEFLSSQMDPAEVLAVEVRQYVGSGLKTLVPVLVTPTRDRKPARSNERDTEVTFFQKIGAQGGDDAGRIARDLKNWIEPLVTQLRWGRGSMIPTLDTKGGQMSSFFAVRTNGRVEMQFGSLRGKPGFEQDAYLEEFWRLMNKIESVRLPPESSTRFPSFQLTLLTNPKALRAFKDAIEWAIERTKTSALAAAQETNGGVPKT